MLYNSIITIIMEIISVSIEQSIFWALLMISRPLCHIFDVHESFGVLWRQCITLRMCDRQCVYYSVDSCSLPIIYVDMSKVEVRVIITTYWVHYTTCLHWLVCSLPVCHLICQHYSYVTHTTLPIHFTL